MTSAAPKKSLFGKLQRNKSKLVEEGKKLEQMNPELAKITAKREMSEVQSKNSEVKLPSVKMSKMDSVYSNNNDYHY